jgi:hypothetical protein
LNTPPVLCHPVLLKPLPWHRINKLYIIKKKENNIPAKRITLPHTKIQGEISSDRYLLRDNITPDGHGVMPAYYTVPVVEELINNIDKAKQIALELIRKGGSH